MRLPLLFLAFCLHALTGRAEWRITSRQSDPPHGVFFEQIEVTNGASTASIQAVIAQSALYTFAVIDDPAGELRVATAGAPRRALATINGGYFQPDHEPLGLVLSDSRLLHPLQARSTLLTGLIIATPRRPSILRLAEYKAVPTHLAALQAGPFLIDGGRPVPGLNATRSAARSIAFIAKDGEFGFLQLRSATLADTAQILSVPELIRGHPITRALNLDGGSSCGLWVKTSEQTSFSAREFKQVRTYLSIVPR